ncbi:MAG: OmpA family protein, partial [Ketobacter sp.]
IVIQGHADAIGPEIYNDTLSRERAKSVESFLKANLDPEQWKVEGFGESQPIASNENPNGREQNRRVVVEYISSNKPLAMMQ